MNKMIKSIIFAGAFIALVASPVMAIATPQATYAANDECEKTFLGVPPWYRGLTNNDAAGKCSITGPSTDDPQGLQKFIWKIALNVIQIGLAITGWLALFLILYSGFLFITGGSNASQIEKARKSIFNAVIGLVISLGAIAVTNLIFGVLDGATTNNEFGVPEIAESDLFVNILNLLYYVGGIAAVIVIVVAGLMYATSAGDSGRITRAKNMILYSVVGIVVLIGAFAITNFVLEAFK